MKKTLAEKEVVTTKVIQVPTYTIEFTEEQAAILVYLLGKVRGGIFETLDGESMFCWLKRNLPDEVLDVVEEHSDQYWGGLRPPFSEGVSKLSDDLKELSKQNI